MIFGTYLIESAKQLIEDLDKARDVLLTDTVTNLECGIKSFGSSSTLAHTSQGASDSSNFLSCSSASACAFVPGSLAV